MAPETLNLVIAAVSLGCAGAFFLAGFLWARKVGLRAQIKAVHDAVQKADERASRNLGEIQATLDGAVAEVDRLRHDVATFEHERRNTTVAVESLQIEGRQPITSKFGVTQLTQPYEEIDPGQVPALEVHTPIAGRGVWLQERVEKIRVEAHLNAVVVADAMGFPVACVGRHAEALCAFDAVLSVIRIKAPEMLPIGDIQYVEMRDSRNAKVTARKISTQRSELFVLTLGGGDAETSSMSMNELVRGAPAIGF